MKRIFLFLVAIQFISYSNAQDIVNSAKKVKQTVVSSEYDRNSMTYIGVDYGESYSNQVFNKFSNLPVPDKFYDNTVSPKVINVNNGRGSVNDYGKLLNQNQVGQKIIAKWFNRQADGTFNVDVLKKRGMFNANDDDFLVASASKRGEAALMDMGLGLVNKSYVLVVDFDKLMTMKEYYDQLEVKADQRTMNGYKANVNAYLYKLNFNDSVAAYFFQDYWMSNPDEAKKAAFESANFPFQLVQHIEKEVRGAQFNPGHILSPSKQKSKDELMKMLVETAQNAINLDIENKNSDFRVKAYVFAISPIAAKIGKKEGLGFDQRYFVYENKEKANGKVVSKRRAVVKSMKVVDNRKVTTGETEPSLFYKIAGGTVDAYGMFLEQKNAKDLNIFAGFTSGGFGGATVRAEYYIGKMLYSTGRLSKGLTSLKIYAEGAFSNEEHFTFEYAFARGSFGLSKDFYPLSFLHWGPFIGYGMESASDDVNNDKVKSEFIEAGARVGVNLTYNIQLVGSANFYMLLGSDYEDPNGDVTEGVDYDSYFEDRTGPGISVGLRIML